MTGDHPTPKAVVGAPETAPRTHVSDLEQAAYNPMPKTRDWHDLRLFRYDGTDLYQWFGKQGMSVFEVAGSDPFRMAAPQASLPPVEGAVGRVIELLSKVRPVNVIESKRLTHVDDDETGKGLFSVPVAHTAYADLLWEVTRPEFLAALSPVPSGGGEPVALEPDEGGCVTKRFVIFTTPGWIPEKKGGWLKDDQLIDFLREVVLHDGWKPGFRATVLQLTWDNDLWVSEAVGYLWEHDNAIGPRRARKAWKEARARHERIYKTAPAAKIGSEVEAFRLLTKPYAAPVPAVEAGWPEVTDEWAETYCALVGREPDGAEFKVVEGVWRETSFRDLSKGEIKAMLCAAPKSAVRALAAPSAPGEPPASPPAETGEGFLDDDEARAEAWSDRVEIQNMVEITSSVFAKWASPELLSRFRQQMMGVIQQAYIEGAVEARTHPASDQSDTERMRAFIKNVAASDWTETDLQYLAVNVRHSRGSLKLETKRDAASAALTLKAILIEARGCAALAEKAADQ